MLFIVTGLVRAGHDDRLGGQPLETAALLLWTVYAMSIVTIAGLMCVKPWYRRRSKRFELVDEPASLLVRGRAIRVQIVNLSVTGARVRLSRPLVVPLDQPMHLHKRHVGLIPCTLAYLSSTEVALVFVPSVHQDIQEALVRDLYINPVVQGNQHAAFALWPVLKHMGRLLVARSQVRSMPRGSWPRLRYPPSSQGLLAARGYGGARTQVPGDGSPAHQGLLLLDEQSEFRRDLLELLR